MTIYGDTGSVLSDIQQPGFSFLRGIAWVLQVPSFEWSIACSPYVLKGRLWGNSLLKCEDRSPLARASADCRGCRCIEAIPAQRL